MELLFKTNEYGFVTKIRVEKDTQSGNLNMVLDSILELIMIIFCGGTKSYQHNDYFHNI